MHLQKLPDGSIRLSRLNPWDVQTFRSLPALALRVSTSVEVAA